MFVQGIVVRMNKTQFLALELPGVMWGKKGRSELLITAPRGRNSDRGGKRMPWGQVTGN